MSVFATFLVLSYVKTLNVSIDILTFNSAAFDVYVGDTFDVVYLVINGSMPHFSHEHNSLCCSCYLHGNYLQYCPPGPSVCLSLLLLSKVSQFDWMSLSSPPHLHGHFSRALERDQGIADTLQDFTFS